MHTPVPLLLNLVILLCFTTLEFAEAGKRRQHYGGRVLNIAPKDCTSSRYPGLVGTCMISLECQQRSGTVIGACRDGHLFGACCADAAEFPTASPLEMVSTLTSTENVKPFKIPQGLLNLANFNIASDDKDHNVAAGQETNLLELFTTKSYQNTVPTTRAPTTTTRAPTTTTRATTTTTRTTTTPTPAPTTTTRTPITTTRTPTTTPRPTTTTTNFPIIKHVTKTSASVPTTTPTTPSIASESSSTNQAFSTTTKFVYGKLKYSPRPVTRRSTTEKMIWTRPPTTESSYSVFTSSNEEDEDEEEENEVHKRRTSSRPTSPLTPTSGNIETSTIPLTPISQSTEEVAVTSTTPPIIAVNETSRPPSTFPTQETTKTIQPKTTKTVENVGTKESVNHPRSTTSVASKTVTSIASTATTPQLSSKVTLPMNKNSRRSNEIVEDNDDTESNSDAWDNKINELVNQVVEGIAEELDKSNIDDVVFKGPSSTTHKPTTAISTKKKSNKPSISTKSKPSSIKKPKITTTTESPKKKIKLSKKKVRPITENNVEIERDVLDYREVCGVRPLARNNRNGRIVGGNPSIHGNWPWHALVKETVWWGIYSKIKCGGVLIGPQHVLTAGHCQPQQTGTLSVVLGVTDSDNPSSHAVTKGVRRVIRHPMFNPRSYENDIAILELDSPVQFQPHIVPICLPDLKETFVGKKGFVTGMGLLKHDGERPSMLYEVDVPILNNTDCTKMFRRSGNMKPIKPSFICAGYRRGRKDSCGGDSGGPLSVKRKNGQWVLAGTVSHGIKCAVPNQPGVYMRTTWYLPWIEKVLRSAKSDLPKCHGPPPICEFPQARRPPQARSSGLIETIFRVLRIARRLWKA